MINFIFILTLLNLLIGGSSSGHKHIFKRRKNCAFSTTATSSTSLSSTITDIRGGSSKMSENRLNALFAQDEHKARLVTYLTAGYPGPEETVDLLLAMQKGGADIIELGVPFTDPQADGATIQHANQVALKYSVSLTNCLKRSNLC